jgi:subtilisin family serine protease
MSNVTWGSGTNTAKATATVKRLADTAENRAALKKQAAQDKLPSALVDLGDQVALVASGQMETQSRVARSMGPVLKAGDTLKIDGQAGSVLFTDDGFAEIDAKDVVVAVIDTGIDTKHPAFEGRLVKPYNAVDGSTNVEDTQGHGTHCAGIIAGSWDIRDDAAGVAPNVKIMPIKAAEGASFSNGAIVKGIRYAVDNGAKVISMSLGGPMIQPSVHKAIEYARSKGVMVLVASGNESKDKVSFPARYEEGLAVGSSKDGKRSSFSNGGEHLDLSAPGERILAPVPGQTYGAKSGTSMATPYAAGAAALVIAQHPDWTVSQVTEHLKRAVNDRGTPGWDKDFGYGEVNLFKAVYGKDLPEVKRETPVKKPLWEKVLSFFNLY